MREDTLSPQDKQDCLAATGREAEEFPSLARVCEALCSSRLRLRPRERLLALALAVESFGRGTGAGRWDVRVLLTRLGPAWRARDIISLANIWRRAGWLALDEAAGEYRLAPDRLPGWAECFGCVAPAAELQLGDGAHVGSLAAEISQRKAAEISRRGRCDSAALVEVADTGPPKGRCNSAAGTTLRSETFNRLNVRTIKRYVTLPRRDSAAGPQAADGESVAGRRDCAGEGAEIPRGGEGQVAALMGRVRAFVGEADWGNPHFWNAGAGWRGRMFLEEGPQIEAALNWCEAGLRSGESALRKTRGAMLWNRIQHERREVMQKGPR